MKRYQNHIVGLLALLLLGNCDTESNVEPRFDDYFIKYYGNEGNQQGVDLAVLPDGFAVLGTSRVGTRSSIQLVRTDALGNEVWSVLFGGDNMEANAMEVDASGNFIIAATHATSVNDKDIAVFRLDPNGVVTDSLAFGVLNEIEEANDITLTTGGDIIVIGSTTNVDVNKPGFNVLTDIEDIYSIRLDPGFIPYSDVDWRRVTGFPGIEEGHSILEKADGSFLFYGTTDRPPSSSQKSGFNMFLYPAANDGQAISVTELQLFGTLADESAAQMVPTIDGGVVMIGTSTIGVNENDIYLARVRSDNQFLSAGLLNSGKNIMASSILESSQGGLILLGREVANNTGDLVLIRTTVNGAILWENDFGGVDDDYPGIVKELMDGSIILVGTIELESQSKICLIKTTSRGLLKK